MSLTKVELKEMWLRTERLEHYIDEIPPHVGYKKALKDYVRFMKNKIQSVIGQME